MIDIRGNAARAVLLLAVLTAVFLVLRQPALGDVRIYRGGAHAVGGDLYGFRMGVHGFTYPPFAALAFGAIAWLPVPAMWAVLAVASCAALAAIVGLSAPALLARVRRGDVPAAAVLGALVLAQPVVATVRWGQVNLLLAALVMLDVLVLRRGALVGLAAAVKLTPGLFVVFLLLRGRWREAGGACATFLATVLLGFLVMPAAAAHYWTHVVLSGDGVGRLDRPGNESIRGLAERLFGTASGTSVWAVAVVPVLVVGLALARRLARDGAEVLAVGVVGVTACLVSPMSWTHHWVWAVPVLAACVKRRVGTAPVRMGALGLVGVWSFVSASETTVLGLAAWDTGYVPAALVAGGVAGAFALGRRCLHSPGVSARLDLALVYPECQLESPVRPTAGPPARPSVAGTTDSGSDTFP